MIDFIFTLDYEIYGNGKGSLKELVYEPAGKLIEVFKKHKAKLVFFVEVAELESIDSTSSDPFINRIKDQIKYIRDNGFEIGLHIHPQWYRAQFKDNNWLLNYAEYNLASLPENRIKDLLDRALSYLRSLVIDSKFTPYAYRAGNWLINPARKIAPLLASHGIKIDSSVFKGGYQSAVGLDYRQAPSDLYFWKFTDDAIKPAKEGVLIEIPIFIRMITPWKFIKGKRLSLEKDVHKTGNLKELFYRRFRDFIRWRLPLKFDFCRLDYKELTLTTEEIIKRDKLTPLIYKPIVLIGHTKDKPDIRMIDTFLTYLEKRNIRTAYFQEVAQKIAGQEDNYGS